ncbi:putative exopolygalacturonase X [Colletotrichum spaethianum]|uniref:galacturonan 1,4-alpha-galacturonidase n=1 Tax=Colletotrichum spaethianum TaxID=700344 RepID=A0AA37US07_9PEZI|nr:putative exopolygalacturonase X [Colletotrichum spaethianum]GKT51767.1 putative exopolygalacturonase X [Colletotrichum spaethianum]
MVSQALVALLYAVGSAAALTCQVAAILAALKQCNNGGTIVLDKTYTIGSVLQTDFLSNIAIQLSGTISLSTDLSYWQKNSIQLTYQDAYTAWAIGGTDIHIFGGGTYNGGGDGKHSIILQNQLSFADQVT